MIVLFGFRPFDKHIYQSLLLMILKKYRPLLFGAGLLFITQCKTTDQDLESPAEPFYTPESYNSAAYTEYEAQKEVESVKPESRREATPFDLEPWIDRPEVQMWIKQFTGPGKAGFERHLERGETLRPIIESVLIDKGMPTDLYYLALIESGFRPSARSHKAAVGVWQFMKGTGKRYGLRSNYYVDERRDPIRATIAASGYLSDLYRVFQSWFLAFSAYSTGEGRVLNAIMRHETRNYWKLLEKKALHRETRNYVPKFIAAAWVARNAEKYGIRLPGPTPWPELQGVRVPSGISLAKVSSVTGITLKDIKMYNPHLLRGVIPPGRSSYSLWLPKFQVSQDTELALLKLKSVRRAESPALADGSYRIKRGDSLYSIARKFGVSSGELKNYNNLKSNRLIAGKYLHIPGREKPDSTSTKVKTAAKQAPKAGKTTYTVRRGDSLYSIARTHGTSVATLKHINQLRRNSIRPGQKLRLSDSTITKSVAKTSQSHTYKVRPGDTLAQIARKFRTSIRLLKRKNQLSSNMIYPGQVLKV